MKLRWLFRILVAAALIASVVIAVLSVSPQLTSLAGAAAADEGNTWVATLDGNDINFSLLRSDGRVLEKFSVGRKSGGEVMHIADMAVDSQGRLYYLCNYTDERTGEVLDKQVLSIRVPGFWPFGRNKTVSLGTEGEGEAVRFINLHATAASALSLIGVGEAGNSMERRVLDIDAALSGRQVIKDQSLFSVVGGAGVYQGASVEDGIAYISMTGKVYLTTDATQQPRLIYPLEGSATASYAAFISPDSASSVIIGEQTGGAILRLYTAEGSLEYLLERGQGFSAAPYSGREVLAYSRAPGGEGYTVLMQNPDSLDFEFVVSYRNASHYIESVSQGVWYYVGQVLAYFLLIMLVSLVAIAVVYILYKLITDSRTLLLKLVLSSVPLIVVALVLFTTYSYFSYQNALTGTYETKVADQGDLMRALISPTSSDPVAAYDQITAPGLYGSTQYLYLVDTMATRDVYTASAYYADGRVYTGPGTALPTLYPYGISGDSAAYQMLRRAALTGEQQTGIIDDAYGRRIACITPVGSSSGSSVFLLETSIFEAEIQHLISQFLVNYLLIAAACVVAAVLLLVLAFTRIVRPVRLLIDGLDRFSRGDRTARIITESNDELADMARVFNKMANDIDAQIFSLKEMSDVYYRFVPQRIFRLLGKQNLGQVTLGSSVEGEYCILNARFYPHSSREEDLVAMTNRFFALVHEVSNQNDATVVSDSVNLRELTIICPSGDAAVQLAMQAIARVDAANASAPIARILEVSFLLHATGMCFAVLGDEDRYIPSMISAGMEQTVARCEDYRRLSSRLLVTEDAFKQLEDADDDHRFIGYAPDDAENGIGLYDFYGSGSNADIRLIRDTKGPFGKAMELYLAGRYYDAKNLFAAVLRENHHDNVARHYIFLSEKKL